MTLIDPTVTCEGYGLWVEESIARALAEERSKVGLWYWDEDVQANKMKRELFEEISRLYSSLDNQWMWDLVFE